MEDETLRQDEALRAYPLLEGRTDPITLSFDYETEYGGDGPVDWWADARYLLCRFMREAPGDYCFYRRLLASCRTRIEATKSVVVLTSPCRIASVRSPLIPLCSGILGNSLNWRRSPNPIALVRASVKMAINRLCALLLTRFCSSLSGFPTPSSSLIANAQDTPYGET